MEDKLIIKYLETTSRCNYDCPMCIEKTRNSDMLKKDFYSIVENNRDILSGQRVWLNFCGEPLMDEHIFERISFLTSIGAVVQLTTNGFFLNDTNIINIINSGIDYIVVSVPSLSDKIYKQLCGVDNLHIILENVFKLKQYINNFKSQVQVQAVGVNIGTDFDKEKYINFFHERGIDAAVHQFTNRARHSRIDIPVEHIKISKRSQCVGLKQNITILSNCDVVTCCCNLSGKNSLGNLRDFNYSMIDLIKSSKIDEFINKKNVYIYKDICKDCNDWIYYQKNSPEEYVELYELSMK